ncbi:S-adenosyl-L-methionine-dependent methyltransferase [Flagelloscypha sp. PMI_526]|nr:S-adenosyl-L-methionine-dependent methyltransferase [Flagelloscypha sp. PMI_526]
MLYLVQRSTRLAPQTFIGPSSSRQFSTSVPHRKWWNIVGRYQNRVRDVTRVPGDKWQYNPDPFSGKVTSQEESYPTVTADQLRSYTEPPREVKMLVRDWIEDSLYNPNYGYFSRQATIYTSGDELGIIDFAKMRSAAQFQDTVSRRYLAQYGEDGVEGPGRQMWHTPTELFRPFYGQAIAKCLVSEYLLKYFPYEDLVIYEIGAGNGSLAIDILDYLKLEYPDVYERTQYHIIEASAKLFEIQRAKLVSRHPLVTLNHKSVFDWDKRQAAPCYFLALEVIDNFAHDQIAYSYSNLQPYEALVTVSKDYDLDTIYQPVADPLIQHLLNLRHQLGQRPPYSRLFENSTIRNLYKAVPFNANLTPPEFIPTRLLSLLLTLRTYFPRHRLLLSDFSSLPDTVPNTATPISPVVQTRVQGRTVTTESYLVQPGWFDIFFPTDFEGLREMYEMILRSPLGSVEAPLVARSNYWAPSRLGEDFFFPRSGSSGSSSCGGGAEKGGRRQPVLGTVSATGLGIGVGERKSGVWSHKEFVEMYGDVDKTVCRNGENPMVDFYNNVKVLF